MFYKNGAVDIAQLMDETRLADLSLQKATENSANILKYLSFTHDAFLSEELDESKVRDLKTKYGITNLNHPIVMSDSGDVVTLDALISGIQSSNSSDIDEEIESIQGNAYLCSEVIAEMDEQYVSSVCYTTALQTIANANYMDNRVDSSMYMSTLPESIKRSASFDEYANYYANVMDMQDYSILQKAQAINNLATLSNDQIDNKFIINFEGSNYTGVSPISGWLWNAVVDTTAAIVNVVSSLKTFKDYLIMPFKLLGSVFKLAFPKIADAFKTDVFKKNEGGYQNLIDIPFFQFEITVDQLSYAGDYYINIPQYERSVLNAFGLGENLYQCGASLSDFINWMGYSKRIEIPLKGVTYYVTYDDTNSKFIFQCFLGLVKSHGLDSYVNGQAIIAFWASPPSDNGSEISNRLNWENYRYSDLQNDRRSSGQFFKSLDNMYWELNVQLGSYTEDVNTLYSYLVKAAQLALLYPVILNMCQHASSNSDFLHVTDSGSGIRASLDDVGYRLSNVALWGLRSTIVQHHNDGTDYMTPIYGALYNNLTNVSPASSLTVEPGLFKNLVDGSSVSNKTNLTVFNALNRGTQANMNYAYSFKTIASSILNMLLCQFVSLHKAGTPLFGNMEDINIPYVTDSMHFPSPQVRVCTDSENVSKFSSFMSGVAALAGVVIGAVVVGKIVKGIGSFAVTTNSRYLNNLTQLADATPDTPEYNRLLREGRKLRRRMRRLGDIANNTGTAISSISVSDILNSSGDIKQVVKLISGS